MLVQVADGVLPAGQVDSWAETEAAAARRVAETSKKRIFDMLFRYWCGFGFGMRSMGCVREEDRCFVARWEGVLRINSLLIVGDALLI